MENLPLEPPKTKICTHCNRNLPITEFRKRTASKDQLSYHCKMCTDLAGAERYEEKKGHIKIKSNIWNKLNKENRQIINKKYYDNNK